MYRFPVQMFHVVLREVEGQEFLFNVSATLQCKRYKRKYSKEQRKIYQGAEEDIARRRRRYSKEQKKIYSQGADEDIARSR